MDERLDRIIAALAMIAVQLGRIAGQLDPDTAEQRKAAMYEQLAHDLAEDPEKRA